jgi:glycosyltransferase involved in cell wall biosynthesis
MTDSPLISIVTPISNGGEYLIDLLTSIQKQTYHKWQHLILDNCSSDNTHDILAGFKDPRRRIIVEKDRGQSDAINKGFRQASGEILCWINADDYYASDDVLQSVADAFSASEGDIIYGTGEWRFEPQGELKPIWTDPDTMNMGIRFLSHIGLCQPAVFWSKSSFLQIGDVDERLSFAMDYDLWCRFAKQTNKWFYVNKVLVVHRVHPEMKTVKQRGKSLIETLFVCNKHYKEYGASWIERCFEFYKTGKLGLQDNGQPSANQPSFELANRLLYDIIYAIFRDNSPLLLRALLGRALLQSDLLKHASIQSFLNDFTWCANCCVNESSSIIQRFVDEIREFQAATMPLSAHLTLDQNDPINPSTKLKRMAPTLKSSQKADKADTALGYQRLIRFRNRYAGSECVLLCNGPSLRKVDFSLLRDRKLFGLNKIFLGLDLIGRLPDFIVCVNKKVLLQSADKLSEIHTLKFLGSRAGLVLPLDPLTFYFNSMDPQTPRFSTDIVRHVHEGWTVTHAALQIAYYLGFRKVVIVGMDHYFPDSTGKPNEGQIMHGADLNHFDPNYFGFGQDWDLPDLLNSEISYKESRNCYEKDGRIIIDATEGGHCRVFERMSLSDALQYPVP